MESRRVVEDLLLALADVRILLPVAKRLGRAVGNAMSNTDVSAVMVGICDGHDTGKGLVVANWLRSSSGLRKVKSTTDGADETGREHVVVAESLAGLGDHGGLGGSGRGENSKKLGLHVVA